MDEKDFELLEVLDETRNITHAADKLYMTQSALSKRIKSMEQELDWEVAFAHNTEKLGKNGTFGRASYREVLLTRYFREALPLEAARKKFLPSSSSSWALRMPV